MRGGRLLTGVVALTTALGVAQLVAPARAVANPGDPEQTWSPSLTSYQAPGTYRYFRPDGDLGLAVENTGSGIYLANLANGHSRSVLSDSGNIDDALVSADGSTVVVRSGPSVLGYPHQGTTISVLKGFDPQTLTGGTITTYPNPTATQDFDNLALSADGSRLAIGGQGVLLMNTATGTLTQVVAQVTGAGGCVGKWDQSDYNHVALSADGKTLATYVGAACNNGANVASVYDITDPANVGAPLWTSPAPDKPVPSDCSGAVDRHLPIAISADGSKVAVTQFNTGGLGHSTVRVHAIAGGTDHDFFTGASRICSIALSDDGSRLAAQTGNPDYPIGGAFSFDYNEDWGEDVQVTDTTAGATPVLLAQRVYNPAIHEYDYHDPGWSLEGISADGGAVLMTHHFASPQSTQIWVARDPAALALGWPSGAALTSTQIGETFVALHWPTATGAVTTYHITGGPSPVDVAAGQNDKTITGLSPSTLYHFAIVAKGAGGASTGPLNLDVTTTGPAGPGTASLSATVTSDDTVSLTWDPASGVDGYQVLRSAAGGPFIDVKDVATGTTSWIDTTTAGATAYTYRVASVTGAVASPHTVNASVTTGAVAVTSATALPTQTLGYAVPSSAVAVHAVGQPNRTATATLSVTGVANPAPVALTESSPGHYDGSVTVPVGATHLNAASVTLADAVGSGAGHTATATATLGLPVGGALVAHVTTTGYHGRAVASSIAGGWSVTATINASADTTRLIGVPPAGDITVDYVRDADTKVNHGGPAVAVTSGQLLDLPTASLFDAAPLSIATGADGHQALLDVAQGSSDQQVRVASDGTASVTGLDVGQSVTVSLVSSDPQTYRFQPLTPVTAVLQPGSNHLDVPLAARATASLGGTVIPSVAGVSLAGGSVAVVQQQGNTSAEYQSTINADGTYHVDGLLAGLPTTASVKGRDARSPTPQPVSVGAGSNSVDLQVPVVATYQVDPMVSFVDAVGNVSPPNHLDWREAVHYAATLTGPSTTLGAGAFTSGVAIPIVGEPGEPVTLCADGSAGGYSAGCASANLPATTTDPVEVTLTLSAVGRTTLSFPLRNAAGSTDPARTVEVVATRGADVATGDVLVTDGQSLSVPSGGDWDLSFVDPGTSQVLGDRVVSGVGGASMNLGTIQLAAAGPFSGAGNGLVAQQQSVSPGGGLDLAATWSPSTAQGAGSLALQLPPSVGVTDPTTAATVNGSPVTATVSGATVTVPIPAVAAGGSGHATVHLDVVPSADPGSVVVRAAIGSQALGLAEVSLPAVTLEAPARIPTDTLTVSGRAKAGADVTVVGDGVVLGNATASASGAWQAPVTLPPGSMHTLVATTGTTSSPLVSVVIDQFAPNFLSVTVGQADVRTFTRAPGASYPFVVVPGEPMTVSTTLADGSRLTSADVVLDGVHYPMTRSGNTWSVTFVPDYPRGDISFSYVEAQLPTDLTIAQLTPPKPTLDQYLNGLPPSFAQAVGTPTATVSSDGQTATVTAGAATLHLTKSDGTGVSTTGKRQIAQGVWVLAEPTYSVSGDTVSGSVTLLVHDPSAGRPDGRVPAEVIPYNVIELGFVVATGEKSALEAPGSIDKYDQLNDLLNQATGCSQSSFNGFKDQLDDLLKKAIATDTAAAALQIGGLLLGPETFGLGTVAMWAVGELLQATMDHNMDLMLQDIQNAIASDSSCKPVAPRPGPKPGGGGGGGGSGGGGPGRPGGWPGAHPSWIYDPSGTITDGVNPIQGATATLSRSNTQGGTYTVWNAADYEQDNNQVTGANGSYGWNVPEGWYVVTATAPDRLPASSNPLQVLPPRTGIDLVLAPDQLPTVVSATATGDVVTVTFHDWMRTAFLTGSQLTLTDSGGHAVAATVTPVSPQVGTDGQHYAKAVTLTVAAPPAAATLTLKVAAGVQDVAGRPMADDYSTTVTVAGVPSTTNCAALQQAAALAAAVVTADTVTVAKDRAALTKATKKLKKLKKAHAPASKIKAAKKQVKTAKTKLGTAQSALATATTASAAAAQAAAACH